MTDVHDPVAGLPFVDEHRARVAASATDVWKALGASLPGREAGSSVGARVLAARPAGAEGDPLVVGSTIPGFAVRAAVPGRELVLAGRHRFSDYSLVFTLDETDGVTELCARTRARFPGLRGRVYRALVVGSGGHRVIVRRWLDRIRRAAEHTD